MASDHYKQVKNYLENEWKLSERIAKIVTEVTEKAVERHVKAYFEGPNFRHSINAAISVALSDSLNGFRYGSFFNSISPEALKYIRDEVREGIKNDIIKKLRVDISISDNATPKDSI